MGIIAFILLIVTWDDLVDNIIDFRYLGIVGISFLNPDTKIMVFKLVVKC